MACVGVWQVSYEGAADVRCGDPKNLASDFKDARRWEGSVAARWDPDLGDWVSR